MVELTLTDKPRFLLILGHRRGILWSYAEESGSHPMPETLSTSQWTPFPVELVFAFFANPGNLPHLMPKWQQARVESSRLVAPPSRPVAPDPTLRFQSPAAGMGSEMAISFRPVPRLPLRVGWLARITEFVWNSHFCDEQIKGPFASWRHRHSIVAETRADENGAPGESREPVRGTLISDEVEYSLPLGPLGSAVHGLFVRRQMEATFVYRQARLEAILPVAARQAARRS
jgi:ligand-binding SRPBCC domain-containing protein